MLKIATLTVAVIVLLAGCAGTDPATAGRTSSTGDVTTTEAAANGDMSELCSKLASIGTLASQVPSSAEPIEADEWTPDEWVVITAEAADTCFVRGAVGADPVELAAFTGVSPEAFAAFAAESTVGYASYDPADPESPQVTVDAEHFKVVWSQTPVVISGHLLGDTAFQVVTTGALHDQVVAELTAALR